MPAATIWQRFDLPGADVRLAQFCNAASAQHWFTRLHAEVPWERHRLRLFGRQVEAPRLSCWIGDADAVYTYSGTRPCRMPDCGVQRVARWPRCILRRATTRLVQSVPRRPRLDGLARTMKQKLAHNPCIASLSFGASRASPTPPQQPDLRPEIELQPGAAFC
jgi:alkylated DNA repair dioxygenase AlkB